MIVGLTSYFSANLDKKADIVSDVSMKFRVNFSSKQYGESLKEIYIGVICNEQKEDSDFYFKSKKKYSKRSKELEYDIRIDFDLFSNSSESECQKIISEELLKSFEVIKDLKLNDFDLNSFKNDVTDLLK